MLGNLPSDYKAQEQLAIRKAATYEADQAKDPYVQFNKGVDAVGRTLGGWAQNAAELMDKYSLNYEGEAPRNRAQETLQAFGETSAAIMHPIQDFAKDRLMDLGMGYEQAKAATSLGELMIATGTGKRLLRAAGRTRLPTGNRSVGAARAPGKRLNTVLTQKAVDVAAELSDWMSEGVMPPMMQTTLAKLNPKNFPIYRGTYEAFRAAAIAQIKHKNNPDGISPTEFYKTVGVFPKADKKTGELNLILPRGDKAQATGLQFPTTGNVSRYTGKRKENLSAQTYGAPTFFKIPGTDAHHIRPPATYRSFFENLNPVEQHELARFAAEDLMLPLGDSEFNAAWIDEYTHNLGIHKYDRRIGHKPGQRYNKSKDTGISIPKEYTLAQRKVALQVYAETIQANMDEAMFAFRMAKQFPQNNYWIKQAKNYLNDYLDTKTFR